VFAAAVTGWLAQMGWDRRFRTTILAMLLGNVVIYLIGLPWLAVFIGIERVVPLGLLPFIPGDLLKLGLGALVLPGAWKVMQAVGYTRTT
jgi:biotin transporter BioY